MGPGGGGGTLSLSDAALGGGGGGGGAGGGAAGAGGAGVTLRTLVVCVGRVFARDWSCEAAVYGLWWGVLC